MTLLHEALRRLEREVARLDTGWALVGGLALAVRAEPRMTRDVDIAIAVSNDVDAQRIVHSFTDKGYRLAHHLEHEDTARLATVRLVESTTQDQATGMCVDLLFASSGIEGEVVAAAERLDVIPGLTLPVATTGHLLALKVLAARPQDLADVHSLLKGADSLEIERARTAIRLIRARGYHRGRPILEEFEALLSAKGK